MRIFGLIVIAVLAALMIYVGFNGGMDMQIGFGFLLVGMSFILHQMPDRPEQSNRPEQPSTSEQPAHTEAPSSVPTNTVNIND